MVLCHDNGWCRDAHGTDSRQVLTGVIGSRIQYCTSPEVFQYAYPYPSDLSPRTLTMTPRRVIWISASQPEAALGLRYQQIVMHAISRDTSSFPRPCIYLQLDSGSEDMRQQEGGEDGEEEEEEAPVEAEIRLVPEDAAKGEQLSMVVRGFGARVFCA